MRGLACRAVIGLALVGSIACSNRSLYEARRAELEAEGCEPSTWFADADRDGAGDPDRSVVSCEPPPGHVSVAGDCDDANDAIRPGAIEVCNGVDDDCDERVDDDAVDAPVWFPDGDGDTFGGLPSTRACVRPAGHVATGGDCDDADGSIHPDATESCDAADRDCDGDPYAGAPVGEMSPFYADDDGDGYGAGAAVLACVAPPDHAPLPGDCDDADAGVNPSAVERCAPGDEDCDGLEADDDPDVADAPGWAIDADHDGYGGPDVLVRCEPIPGRVALLGDCDDADPSRHPGATEHPADAVDQDCDGLERCFVDLDGDGFGDAPTLGPIGCVAPDLAPVGGDCDDGDPGIGPHAAEAIGDGVDQNCDGADACFADLDGDGWGAGPSLDPSACGGPDTSDRQGDCDDANPAAHPGAVEFAGDGVDQDCDGLDRCWVDVDGDGYGQGGAVPAVVSCVADPAWAAAPGDCAPTDPAIHPGAAEIPGDGVDQDCDGVDACFQDRDGDGWGRSPPVPGASLVCDGALVAVGGDCDDDDGARYPGAPEIPGDGLDQDCDGLDLCFADLDLDGWGGAPVPAPACVGGLVGVGGDCDDDDASIAPDRDELPGDGIDQDCDGAELCWEDGDGDGFGVALVLSVDVDCADPGEAGQGGDCDDGDPAIHPGLGLVWSVPGDFPDPASAVAGACDSDTIAIGPGVWSGPLDLRGRELHLVGAGPASTVLDGAGGPLLRLDGGSVRDLRLTLGRSGRGGCVEAVGDGITLEDLVLSRCTSDGSGGGVYAEGAGLTLARVAFDQCVAAGPGGGLHVAGPGTTASSVDVSAVEGSASRGGGLAVTDGAALVGEGLRFERLVADGGGAVALIGAGSVVLDGVEAVGNDAIVGSFLEQDVGSALVRVVRASVREHPGPAAALRLDGFAEVRATEVVGGGGPGLFVRRELDLRHVASVGNAGPGVIAEKLPAVPRSVGLLLAFNGGAGLEVLDATPSVAPIAWSLLVGNAGGDWVGAPDFTGVDGNVSADPLLQLAPTSLPFALWDLTLGAGSPCVDLGGGPDDPDGSPADCGARGGPFALEPSWADDTDGDGLPDAWELRWGLLVGSDDAADDPDGDGLDNLEEWLARTRPDAADTDGDGVDDPTELALGRDPRVVD